MDQQLVRQELIGLLGWENAHVNFETATAHMDLETIGVDSHHIPYSIWQLAEHIRIAQKDIVDFCIDEDYQEPNWPDDYWPKARVPQSIGEWQNCVRQVLEDRRRMADLISSGEYDLFEPFPQGAGQHLFREAMLIIDHETYHTGQIVLIRKMLGKWR